MNFIISYLIISSYAGIASTGKKVIIFTDNICSGIRMNEVNNKLNEATAQDMEHYSIRALENDQPDVAVIHAGSNSIPYENPNDIAQSILKIVESCNKYGVNEVFVSSLICNPRYGNVAQKVNALLESYIEVSGCYFIDNSNIYFEHIWRDKTHLNNEGTIIITEDFIDALTHRYEAGLPCVIRENENVRNNPIPDIQMCHTSISVASESNISDLDSQTSKS